MDVINLISKVQSFPDADIFDPKADFQPGHKFYANGPRLHEYLREMNEKVLSKYHAITVGEMPFVNDQDEILKVVGRERNELNMIFIFEVVDISNLPGAPRLTLRPWKVKELRDIISKWQNVMREKGGWNSVFISNHDNVRDYNCHIFLMILLISCSHDRCRNIPTTLTDTVNSVRNYCP